MARTFIVGLVLLAACAKKDDDAPRPTAKSRESAGVGVVNAGLASAQGSAAESAKASLVAQECALACGVHPENDPGQCTQKCAKECATTADLPGIDACAQRAVVDRHLQAHHRHGLRFSRVQAVQGLRLLRATSGARRRSRR